MKMEIIDYFRPVPTSSALQSFDALKFIKRLKAKEKIGWWRRFLNGVEEKRNEILHDLQQYRSAQRN
jgi:hypothetical protein